MSARDDLRAAVEQLAAEWENGQAVGYDRNEQVELNTEKVHARTLRALLAEYPAPEPPSGYAVPAGHHDPLRPGTPVLAWPGSRESSPLVTRTRSEVWALASGDRVVMVEGCAGGIALTHIDVLPEPPSGGVCAFGGADDTNPSAGRAGEVTAEELDTAAYWQGRFLRMRAMYRERFNEGLSTEDWHRKHCGLMNAPEVTADELAAHLAMSYGSHVSPPHGGKDWRAADALLARYDVRRRP